MPPRGWKKKDPPNAPTDQDPLAVDDAVDPAQLKVGEAEGDASPDSPEIKVRRRRKSKKLDVNGLEATLLSVHFMLAALLKQDALALEKGEATQLAEAIGNVARHYDIPEVPEKMIDWANLLIIAFMVYRPKMAAVAATNRKRREEAKLQAEQNAVPLS